MVPVFDDAEIKEFHRIAQRGAEPGSPRWAQYQLILYILEKLMASIQQYDTDVAALIVAATALLAAYQGNILPQATIDAQDASAASLTTAINAALNPPAPTVAGGAGTDTTAGAAAGT